MGKLLSIIIPCYNVLPYAPECFRSVVEQITDEVEVIIINDGSTDGLDVWIDKNSELKTEGVIVINQENSGLSTTRNEGLSRATGQYIAWLDGDDFYKKNSLSKILSCLRKNQPDLLIVNFEKIWDDGGIASVESIRGIPKNKLIDVKKNFVISKIYDGSQLYVWRYIFKRDLYDGIQFPVAENFEDIRTLPKLFDRVNTCFYLPLITVSYRQRQGSIVTVKNESNVKALAYAHKEVKEFISGFTWEDKVSFSAFSLKLYVWSTIDAFRTQHPEKIHKQIVGSYHDSVVVPMRDAELKLKDIDKFCYKAFKILTLSDSLYLPMMKLYGLSKIVRMFARKLLK